MKKNLLKTALFISMVIGISYMSCKPGDFTEEDAMLLQSKLEKQKILVQDSLDKAATLRQDALDKAAILLRDALDKAATLRADSIATAAKRVTYTLCLVDASKSTLFKGGDAGTDEGTKGLIGGSVSLTQGGVTVTKTTVATGLVVFDNLKPGIATLHVVLTGYSEVNAMLDFTMGGYVPSASGGIQAGNVLPMIPISGTSTGTIKGTVTCETDLTNKTPEIAPTGTKVIATVSPSSSVLTTITNSGFLFNVSYDGLSLEAVTDATGAFTMMVPGTSMGLDYAIKVSDFTANQSLLMLTKSGLPVTGVQTVPTSFGSTFTSGSSSIPTVDAVTVAIGAPDYTYTQATATAVIYDPKGLDYFVITNAGNYYYPNYNFSGGVTVESPAPATGGNKAFIGFTTNNYGQVISTSSASKGSGYATTAQGATYTLPYIKTAPKITVTATAGVITSYTVSTGGQFFCPTSNVEWVLTTGTGTGATIPMPTTSTSPWLNVTSSGLSFSGTSGAVTLGSGYATGDVFTLQLKSTVTSDLMTSKVFMTTGTVTAINITNEGANYVSSGNVSVVIDPPGFGGTPATATANVTYGKITSMTINNAGTNYSTAPTVTIKNLIVNKQAYATATVDAKGFISGISVTNSATNSGYVAVPTVTLTTSIPSVGTGASATAVLGGAGNVNTVTVTNGGSGYQANYPISAVNAPASVAATVKGTGTTIANFYLGTGKRSIDN